MINVFFKLYLRRRVKFTSNLNQRPANFIKIHRQQPYIYNVKPKGSIRNKSQHGKKNDIVDQDKINEAIIPIEYDNKSVTEKRITKTTETTETTQVVFDITKTERLIE